ncbi:hypothetical protein ACHAWF_013455, partial [Thalassiosira exigua]
RASAGQPSSERGKSEARLESKPSQNRGSLAIPSLLHHHETLHRRQRRHGTLLGPSLSHRLRPRGFCPRRNLDLAH